MKNAKGFLLLEVLTALVIIAVAMGAALTGMSRALKLSGRSEAFTQTALPLESLLFDLETGARGDLLETGGGTRRAGKTFQVERELILPKETADTLHAAVPPFYRLSIRSGEEGAGDFWKTELFLGQEMFS